MGLFGGSDSGEKENETDLSGYETSSVNSYISNEVSKNRDPLSVDEMLENALNHTVTRQRLTKKSFDKSRGETIILSEKSLSDYLTKGEQPHFIFHANGKPPRKDGSKFLKPHHSGGLAVCFTDKRVVLAAGMKDDNDTEKIEYSDLQDYETSKGRMKHRISPETKNSTYDIYISNHYNKGDLQALSDFLDSVISDPTSRPTKKSDSTPKKTEKSDTTPDADSIQDVIPDSKRAERIAKESDSRTVTKPRLTKTKSDVTNARVDAGFTNEPIISNIDENEEVWYILTDKKGGIQTGDWHKKPHQSGQTAFVFTDSRIIAIVPDETEDDVVEINYNSIVDYRDIYDIRTKYADNGLIGVNYVELRIKTKSDNKYKLRIKKDYSEQCWEWIDSVRKKLHSDYVKVVLSYGTGEIGMEVLDRETGEAEMETSGWNYGLGFVERHNSSSKIKKKGYKTTVDDFVIKQNGIEFVYKGRNVERSYGEIGAVDMTSSGFIIYSEYGIYKFTSKIRIDKTTYEFDRDELKQAGKHIQTKVTEADEKSKKKSNSEDTETEDKFEKLEKLAELRDNDVLTEEEFKEKKQELLDEL